MKILIAEDNLMNQKIMTHLLTKLGYNADIAENGEVAVNLERENNYDLIFMDIQMPIMNGVEASEIILGFREFNKPHIIALTANTDEDEIKSYKDKGIQGYIAKPVRVESLEQAIKDVQSKL